ncbi:GAF domain-containing protein [Rossellomorea vietnamensis]|uniref:GAF domain-containing protein n=1 Tax=Rossellomorea vietnamensis TaxID=218284 RepID=A0A5D4MIH5_9BACI|nr:MULTISPECIES: STAS domain-containing protein [Bacillaceae]TYS01377.1 GAF domain-containing protein [Rossellomorea vietnamensis]
MAYSSEMHIIQNQRFRNFEEAADSILRLMGKWMDINTLFIAKNDKRNNEIVKVQNKDKTLLREGDTLPFEETFCKISVDKGRELLFIPDITRNDSAKSLNVTHNLGSGSFVGIPIYYEDGRNYGTICGLDTDPFSLSEEQKEIFETMSSLLSFVLELDQANKQIETLSAPLVPLTQGVAVLPIVGIINEERAEKVVEMTLVKSQEMQLEYLVIDLSGITHINDEVVSSLLRIVSLMKLVGVEPLLTGIRPDIAIQAVRLHIDLKHIQIESNLANALTYLGFTLQRNN